MMRRVLKVGLEQETDSQKAMAPMLKKIQRRLKPEDADAVLAINTETGEFVLGVDYGDAYRAFRAKFGNVAHYACRVDGSPAIQV